MKELSVEERARRYDEAIKRAREFVSKGDVEVTEYIFPELAESKDERIRKQLLEYFKSFTSGVFFNGVPTNDAITWLEKQGEHANFRNKIQIGDKVTRNKDGVLVNLSQLKRVAKPADKVEPKFQEGDWIVSPNGVYWHIDKISNSRYEVTADTGESSNWNLDTNIYHKFNIQDAKAGDVLTTKAGGIFIYKELLYDKPFAYCGVDKFGVFKDCNCGDGLDWTPYLNDVTPATKEQRDLLFQKMKEAGYEWDAEKKELKKIEQKQDVNIQINPSEYINDMGGNGCYLKNTTQNHAWSEEDEDYYNAIITKLEVTQDDTLLTDNQIEFLKSLKERVQPKREWNEENKKMLECAIDMIEWYSVVNKSKSKLVSDWLKSFRPQPNQEWSEEDEKIRQDTIRVLEEGRDKYIRNSGCFPSWSKSISWLKSLRPQNTWKPSDEQLSALWESIKHNLHLHPILKSLYNDLKKLREE